MPRNAIRVGLILLAVAALYSPDTDALIRYWMEEDVNGGAGVLIALMSGFLLFRARARFEEIPVGPVPCAVLPAILCAAASLICWRAGILTLQLFFLPLILWLALLSVLGWQVARLASFPIGFLYFALPGWGLLAPTLQHLTAWAVGVIGPAVGVPVALSGTTILLPGGMIFAIELACSGIDFLIVGLAIATLYGELERARPSRRARLIGGMLLLAIVANWVRVLVIVEIGYRSRMQSALATSGHLALGWVVFACALLAFIWLAGRGSAVAPDALPSGRQASVRQWPGGATRYGISLIGLLSVPALVYGRLLAIGPRASTAELELPPARAPWHGPVVSADPLWQPVFVGAQIERRARYQSADGRTVEVLAVGFPRQSQGARILDEKNSLLGYRGLAARAITLAQDAGIPHSEVITLDPHGRCSLIWSIIDIDGHLFGEPLASQLWYGARSFVSTPYSALFALRAQCDASCDSARAALTDFLRANGPALFESLPDIDPER